MNRLVHQPPNISPYTVVAVTFILYVTVFAVYHAYARVGISSLAVIPVIVQGRKLASLYLGYDIAHPFDQIEIARADQAM
jgi:hypothetical protein